MKSTAQLKDVFERRKRDEILADAFSVDRQQIQGKRLLLFDDLYRSGATAGAIARLLAGEGAAIFGPFANLDADAEKPMMRVFIGGSRAVSRLNAVIREKLDGLIARNCSILVGDANGADKAVQQYFASRGYRQVAVYCMDKCRNNLGSWPTKQISRPTASRDFAYYAAKDLAMAQDANCGVMLWDGRSKGTLNNIQNLVSSGKKTLVYLSPENAFHKLSTPQDLLRLLDRCDSPVIANAQRQIKEKLPSDDQLSLQAMRS